MKPGLRIVQDADSVRQDLFVLEAVIADGLRSFVEVGRALSAIRNGGLYREQGFKTFENYCRTRWEFSMRHCNRLISASDVVKQLGPIGPALNEAQARELAKLEPEAQAEAWAEAVQTAPPAGVTAKHVAEVVAKTQGAGAAARPPKASPLVQQAVNLVCRMSRNEQSAFTRVAREMANGVDEGKLFSTVDAQVDLACLEEAGVAIAKAKERLQRQIRA